MRIYVGGPYSADTEEARLANVERAMDAGLRLIAKGHEPFIPHLNHWWDQRAEELYGHRLSWQTWMQVVTSFIPVCDAFLYLAPSRGTDIELLIAKATSRLIYYHLADVPDKETPIGEPLPQP